MSAPSKEQQLEKISKEMQELTVRRQQLSDRLGILSMLKEFRQNAGFQEEEDTSAKDETEKIQEELKKLSERKIKLQEMQEQLDPRTANGFPVSPDGVFFVESPPPYPAPQVILDVERLPPHPCPTRCPHCQEYVTTEVVTTVGNTAWLICLVCSFIGCVAGCCLLPFCMGNFKDIVHKCPKCRSHLHKCTKL